MTSGNRSLWLLWLCGVAIFPIAALIVLPDVVPIPRMVDFARGVGVWVAWAAGFAAMAFAMIRLRHVSLRSLVVVQLFGGLAFVIVHAMPSIDTYAYLGYGDELLHGVNAWTAGPIALSDGVSRAFASAWGPQPPSCRYGPGFVILEAALVRLFGDSSVVLLVLVQRLLSLFAAVAITALVRGPNARFWALNPFVSYYFVLEAHNDVFFLLALAAAARARVAFFQGVAVGIAGSVKIVALAAFAWSKPKRFVGSMGGAIGMLVALYGLQPLALSGDGLRSQVATLANSVGSLVIGLAVALFGRANVAFVELMVALSVVVIALFVRWSKRDRATLAILLSIVALPVFWPWYLGWALLASVASSSRSTMRFVTLLCVCSFINDLPYLNGFAYNVQVTWLFLLTALLLLVLCRIVPESLTMPGGEQSAFWHARRFLAMRN